MRKTYLSKKEIGSVLETRDVVLNLDDKSSKFDAFYIQNIKQTRRELSCVGSSNAKLYTQNKVRKRKYVRRVVHEKDNILKESPNQSTCLTPDKSLHVKKELDLFDQLLNSSNQVKENKNENLFDQLQCPKQLSNAVIKMYNCSSSDSSSESEKENSTKACASQNVTDIRKHELIIEKACEKLKKDESIFQIEKNLGVINKIINTNQQETPSPLLNQNRLTRNVVTLNADSPLCSTPFTVKYRGKSIYNFSPIAMKDLDETGHEFENIEPGKYVNTEQNNDENNFVDQLMSPVLMCSKTKCNKNKINYSNDKGQKSIEVISSNITSNEKACVGNRFNNNSVVSNAECTFESEIKKVSDAEVELPGSNDMEIDTDKSEKRSLDYKKDRSNITTDSQIQFSTTALPFLGFTKCQNIEEELELDKSSSANKIDQDINKSDKPIHSINNINNIMTDSEIQFSTTVEPFLGFSMCRNTEVVEIDNSSSSNENDSSDPRDSFYNTCCSIECDDVEIIENIPVPVVVVEKMNDSLFDKYYNNRPNNSIEDVSSDTSLLECSIDNADETKVDEKNLQEYVECNINADSNEEYESSEEEKCISFVTMRKRNEIINDSIIMMLNNSQASTSSQCDKTVISRGNRDTLTPHNIKSIEANKQEEISHRLSNSFKPYETASYNKTEIKPIVLQPGKKWERCLSIYRRMTMANDNDASLLDDDVGKGRKYRQSIINCMEIQEKGPLHNDSFSSCRSTIIPNLHRSTIRIELESSTSNISLNSTDIFNNVTGFLSEDCDDTVVQLSKLSIDDRDSSVAKFHDTSERLNSAQEYVLRRCNQPAPILFDECYPDTVLKNCHKIGEGVYGEVFLWRAGDGRARVMKVVPVAGTIKVNGEHQKDFHEIISEIVIAMELSALRAPIATIQGELDECEDPTSLDLQSIENATDVFNEVIAVRCVYGCYPSRLLDLWELYDETKGSENDNPAVLESGQRYIVLELANAGQDLESYCFNSAEQAYSLLLQVAYGLAVGEEAFQFEHRDLHWGNVLIAPTEQKYATFVLRGRAHRVPRKGVAATIIDYSLSRLSLPLGGARSGERGVERAALYNDLAGDDGLFGAVGDYQFDVYRLMRDKLSNNWKSYEPYTNVIWLHYTVDKMITALRYRRTNTKIHKHYIAKLKGVKNRILDYGSAAHFVLTDSEL